MQACNYASMFPCKHTSMQACNYASMFSYASMLSCMYDTICKHVRRERQRNAGSDRENKDQA